MVIVDNKYVLLKSDTHRTLVQHYQQMYLF